MISLFKKLLPFKFKRSVKEKLGVPSLHWSLQNIKRLGFAPKFVVDIGAYEGYWTRDFLEVFPLTNVLMLEAQKIKEPKLIIICSELPNVNYQIALLSSEDGKALYFEENETASHIVSTQGTHSLKIISESVDSILKKGGYPQPDFLKLDVQGFELEVLKGSSVALRHAEFCLLEVSLLNLDDSPLVLEVMNFMDAAGFQAYDILQFMRRPFDKALYQIDLLFIKRDSSFIKDRKW